MIFKIEIVKRPAVRKNRKILIKAESPLIKVNIDIDALRMAVWPSSELTIKDSDGKEWKVYNFQNANTKFFTHLNIAEIGYQRNFWEMEIDAGMDMVSILFRIESIIEQLNDILK